MKNKDLLKINRGIKNALSQINNSIDKRSLNVKFTYALCKNQRYLQAELGDIQKTFKPCDSFTKYQKKVEGISNTILKNFKKEQTDLFEEKSVIVNNEKVIPKQIVDIFMNAISVLKEKYSSDFDKFEKEETALKEEYAEAIKEQDDLIEKQNEFAELDYTGEIEFHKISLDIIPQFISGDAIDDIYELISED